MGSQSLIIFGKGLKTMENTKFVRFDEYCKKCVNKDVEESDPYKPCNDCLAEPARENSERPVNFKEK